MGRENLEIDGLPIDAFVIPSNSSCFGFNLLLHQGKVFELPPRKVMKFSPFVLTCYTSSCVGSEDIIITGPVIVLTGDVDEL
jgi:hypothetical protein